MPWAARPNFTMVLSAFGQRALVLLPHPFRHLPECFTSSWFACDVSDFSRSARQPSWPCKVPDEQVFQGAISWCCRSHFFPGCKVGQRRPMFIFVSRPTRQIPFLSRLFWIKQQRAALFFFSRPTWPGRVLQLSGCSPFVDSYIGP